MRSYEFETLDVFTEVQFGGNPLAVVLDAKTLTDQEMQTIAAEFNFSETTFVLPPTDDSHLAVVRIFNRTQEMAFAGHPSIGTAFVLANRDGATADRMTLRVAAGRIEVEVERNSNGEAIGGRITGPQALTLGESVAPDVVAACVGLAADDLDTSAHLPIIASVGNPFVIGRVKPGRLSNCAPDIEAFRTAQRTIRDMDGRFSLHLYAIEDGRIRARMFAPLSGTAEDPATGSANGPLGALLLSLSNEDRARFAISQGVEMGRPSFIEVEAERRPHGIWVKIAGRCVPVTKGRLTLRGKPPGP